MYSLRASVGLALKCQRINVKNQLSQRYIHRWVAPTLMELTRRKKAAKPFETPRSKYLEWDRNAELYAFNSRLSEKFNTDLLEQALTTRPYIIQEEEEQKQVGIEEPQINLLDNRELIEEGKQITPLIIENYLQQCLPLAPLECIYALKNYLLSNEVLAKTSAGIGTKDLILTPEFPVQEETLANVFYALISALNRSVNLEHASLFVRDILIACLVEKDLLEIWCPEDPEEILNGILEREGRESAEPRIIGQTGVNTLIPVYQIAVYSNREFLGSGFGETIEEGVKMSALNAIIRMFGLLDSSKPIRCNLNITDSDTANLPLAEWCRSKS